MSPQIFFPSEDPAVAIIASLAIYGVFYLLRPIGAVVLGHWDDTHGRKNALLLYMFLMGISTLLVGLFATVAAPGTENIQLVIGSIVFAIPFIAAVAAVSAR